MFREQAIGLRKVLRQRGIGTLDDLTHDQQDRLASRYGVETPELHRKMHAVEAAPQPDYNNPLFRAELLDREVERLRDDAQRAVRRYQLASADGNRHDALTAHHHATRLLAEAEHISRQAARFRGLAADATVSYDTRTGRKTLRVDQKAVRRQRARWRQARDDLVRQARDRVASGDRDGATRLLGEAEVVDRALADA
jgi:hypothetical protein